MSLTTPLENTFMETAIILNGEETSYKILKLQQLKTMTAEFTTPLQIHRNDVITFTNDDSLKDNTVVTVWFQTVFTP